MFSLDGYWTLRQHAAAVRRSDRAVITVTGRDRATWLQGLLTNDVLALQEGQSCYAAYLTPQGRMISDMQVIARPDRIWLDVPAPLAASLRARLDGLIFAEDAQVIDESESIAVWGLYGPNSQAILKGCLHNVREPETSLQGPEGHDRHPQEDRGGNPSGLPRAVPDSSFGVPGFAIYADAHHALRVDLPEANLETLDVLRIEAGTPKFLVDMTEDTIPLEAGIEDRAISFTKGCYVGQEVIVRVTHRGGGRVAKRLVQWEDSSHNVTAGARIVSGERDIGWVTGAAFSPARNALVGLGYVHRDFAHAGTSLELAPAEKPRVSVTLTTPRPGATPPDAEA
jgi:folate-binding protein YgfZ